MGIIVRLKLQEQDDNTAKYYFSDQREDETGIVEIDKKTGKCKIVAELRGDTNNGIAKRAMMALSRDWKAGSLKEKTHFIA